MIVVDASAMVELLLNQQVPRRLVARLLDPRETLHAPHLLDVEVAHVIRRYCLWGDISAERGHQVIEDLKALPIHRHPHDLFLSRMWELRQNVTCYDAVYLVLAEALRAPLITRDQRLASASGHSARVEVY